MLDIDDNLLINNVCTDRYDNEEYPLFNISKIAEPYKKDGYFSINEDIKNIYIIKNFLTWQYNNKEWFVEADVAILIILQNKQVMFIAEYTLAGFIGFIMEEDIVLINIW